MADIIVMNEKEEIKFTCFKARMPELFRRIELLNRRAVRLNVAPVVVTVLGDAEPVKLKNDAGTVVAIRERVNVGVVGEAPKLAGWKLAATLEHTADGNIIRSVPGLALDLSTWRSVPCRCQHCNTCRRRNDTHLVIHDDGTIRQVGSSCIADFLGHADPKSLVALAELWFSVRECFDGAEEWNEGGNEKPMIWVESMLALAACSIRERGFISRAKSESVFPPVMSTRDEVMFTIFPPRGMSSNDREKQLLHPTEADTAFAAKALEFVRGFEQRDSISDFEHNLLVCAKREAVEGRDMGIACFIVEAYRRSTEKSASKASVHFGEPAKRYHGRKVLFLGCTTSFQTNYGTAFVYLLDDVETGARLKWISSVELEFHAGSTLTGAFTVKEHGSWNGQNQTSVSRCKFNNA
jgi:hypothetical protein